MNHNDLAKVKDLNARIKQSDKLVSILKKAYESERNVYFNLLDEREHLFYNIKDNLYDL